jgi:hypothetical protein
MGPNGLVFLVADSDRHARYPPRRAIASCWTVRQDAAGSLRPMRRLVGIQPSNRQVEKSTSQQTKGGNVALSTNQFRNVSRTYKAIRTESLCVANGGGILS